ncbi:hypothetical protein L1987_63650 [Smallanthus sonchifolius]|uniref:Uncharacterized protein n=1 Tax=Smallanthus sonchifolius TaxID=185202 RepID=A0ACB9CDW3_9ASTR|nr:hypothetical protein L1987_63650 [Smallanthus sonchifolius]
MEKFALSYTILHCKENVVKECEEEAGIPRCISIRLFNLHGFFHATEYKFTATSHATKPAVPLMMLNTFRIVFFPDVPVFSQLLKGIPNNSQPCQVTQAKPAASDLPSVFFSSSSPCEKSIGGVVLELNCAVPLF